VSHDLATAVATVDPPAGGPQPFLRANRVTLIAGLSAVALAAAVYYTSPQEHGLDSLWQLLFHLLPFAAATIAIGHLDQDWSRRLRLPLILPPLCFLVFFCYFVSHVFYYFAQNDFHTYFGNLYYTQLMLVPYIILVMILCVRLGGGRTATVIRLGVAMVLLQLSGIEDLSFRVILYLREGQPIPEVWEWADHMAVRLGGHPTKTQAYVFIAVHVLLAGLVLFLPGRLVTAVRHRLSRRPDAGADTGAEARTDAGTGAGTGTGVAG
jgi:hypothetical protein